MAITMRKNTDGLCRGGAIRSSDEALVMRVERRGCIIQLMKLRQPNFTRKEQYDIDKIV
jgi:hypothetical protein